MKACLEYCHSPICASVVLESALGAKSKRM
jgi:hypothetical protein